MGNGTTYSSKEISNTMTFNSKSLCATFVKETLLQFRSHIDPHTLIIGDFNMPCRGINGQVDTA